MAVVTCIFSLCRPQNKMIIDDLHTCMWNFVNKNVNCGGENFGRILVDSHD